MTSKLLNEADAATLIGCLQEAKSAGLIVPAKMGPYMQVSYRGTGKPIPVNWNVQVYEYSARKGGCSVVCVDLPVLRKIWRRRWDLLDPSPKIPVCIDDAGWGFPLLGCMVGVSLGETVLTRMVDVQYFQGPRMRNRMYLSAYADAGMELLIEHRALPDTHRIEICTGWVNVTLRERLRERGWEVRVTRIEGVLQDQLEERFRQEVLEVLGSDIYYDPKELPNAKAISLKYAEAVRFGSKHCPELLKTGWKALRQFEKKN